MNGSWWAGRPDCGPWARGRWGFEGMHGEGWWGGPRGGKAWRARAGRIFEQGDLKYVILRLLEEKPRHGYDIIKALEERFGGAYAPSPGTVYPTLSMLEDLGYATARAEEGGKRIYEITDEGRKHLAEHSDTVEGIFDRIARFVEGFLEAPMMDINGAFRDLGRATYSYASSHISNAEQLAKVREILQRARQEIEALGK